MSSPLNEVYFPRTIPMAFLRGQKFTWSGSVNGGAIGISDLNIKQQSFMGGNVTRLGWITELGLYACPNMCTQDIIALYVHDPLKLTEEGRELVKNAFPNEKVVFDVYKEQPITKEDRRKMNEDEEYPMQQGLPPELVTHASSEELKSLIRAPIIASKQSVLAGKPQPQRRNNGRR